MTKESDEIIECTLDRVVFKNDSGFLIGSFIDNHNNKFSGLGNMINPQVDMNYILTGDYEENSKYGEQFKFHAYETVLPVDTSGIFKYIVRICKFVGTSVGNAIVDRYGEKTLSVMKNDPGRLAKEISGITLDRAKEIQATLKENEVVEKIMIELETLLDVPGMRKSLPTDLIKIYKSDAAEAIKKDPYCLTSFHGISFHLADRVAIKIKYPANGVERKKAATSHVLYENLREGSVWIYRDELLIKVNELIQVPDIDEGIKGLIDDGSAVERDNYYSLKYPAIDENDIAEIIIAMINENKKI